MTTAPHADVPAPQNSSLPAAGHPPTATPAAATIGVLLALAMLAIGAIALRDTVITLGWLHGARWTPMAIAAVDGLRFQWPMVPAGLLAVVVGAAMILSALRPRRRTAAALAAEASIWMSPDDRARLISYAANTVPGVQGVRTTVTRRKAVITVTLADPATAAHTTSAIATAVEQATGILARRPKITVGIRTGAPR